MFDCRLWLGRGLCHRLDRGLRGGLWLAAGWDCRRGRFGFPLCFANRSDHVEGAFGIVLEFVVQDSLTTIQRVFETDELARQAGELPGREKWLGEKTLQLAGAHDHLAVLRRKLLQAEHGNDVLEIGACCASVRRISCARS